MELAEAAQRRALRDLQPRPERSPPPPGTWMPPAPPDCHHASLTETFATASRCVRQAILLEARLDARPDETAFGQSDSGAVRAPRPSSHGERQGDGTSLHYETLEDDLAAEDRAATDALAGIARRLAMAADAPTSQPTPTPPDAQKPRPAHLPSQPTPEPPPPEPPPPKPPRLKPG